MWQNKLIGVLGIWVVALAFLGFSDSLLRLLLVVTGLAIAVFAFAGKKIIHPSDKLDVKEKTFEVESRPASEPAEIKSDANDATSQS